MLVFSALLSTAIFFIIFTKKKSMFIKIDLENYINTAHIVAFSTFNAVDGKVKITIDTVIASSGHGQYTVYKNSIEDATIYKYTHRFNKIIIKLGVDDFIKTKYFYLF
ncbi:hypothetical protein HMPREF0023_0851 [Acinetobacter sp. ATCC 27244]|nr:hypothetical protein HMPREF0023_0851 [Acinetobacter sp. ATCC 27244]